MYKERVSWNWDFVLIGNLNATTPAGHSFTTLVSCQKDIA